MANPVEAIENLTGEKLDLQGRELIVRDQIDESTIYINISVEQSLEDVELSESQLEAVSGGVVGGPNGESCTPVYNPLKGLKIK